MSDDPETPRWDYWRNLEHVALLSIVELSAGIEPGWYLRARNSRFIRDNHEVLASKIEDRLQIVRSAFEVGKLKPAFQVNSGTGEWLPSFDMPSFRAWAESLPSPFDFPDGFPRTRAAPGSIDDFPEELRAAIEAFKAVSSDPRALKGKRPRTVLAEWLEHNRPQLTKNARERIATVANWQPSGGAPKTPTGENEGG